MQLPEYMARTFPKLQLGAALFYNWPIGLRFELNHHHWPNVDWETVLQRACTLYESAFGPGEWGFVVSSHDFEFERGGNAPGRMPELRHSVFALSRKFCLGLHGVAGRQRFISYEDRITQIMTTYRWTQFEARRIDYRGILRAVMHSNFPLRHPRVSDRVYFVNQARDIVLHMYDDRGMDLIAPSVDTLKPIYETHRSWILEHDRPAIISQFGSKL